MSIGSSLAFWSQLQGVKSRVWLEFNFCSYLAERSLVVWKEQWRASGSQERNTLQDIIEY